MKKSLLTVGLAAMLLLAWSIGRVQGQQDQAKVILVSPDHASFHEGARGVSMAPIWGNSDQGAHATFTKFAPGFDAGMHTHTNESGSSASRAPICTKTTPARSGWAQALSCAFPADTSIGAEATRKRARSSTKNPPASSI